MQCKINFMRIVGVMILSVLAIKVTAQDRRMGVKGGLNISNLYVDGVDNENARIGFNVGLYGQLLASDYFALQPELLYSTKGTQFRHDGVLDQTAKFNLNYLDLPVLAVIKLGRSAEIHLGAYASYLLGANITYDGNLDAGSESLDRDNFKSIDFGLVGGFALNFNSAQVGTRYNLGLAKIAEGATAEAILGDAKNSAAQVYAAFTLNK